MRLGVTSLICCLLTAMLGLSAKASGYFGSNCVTYVREVTGMEISGNAGDWWDNAAGSYQRGHQPVPGSVLVFRPYGRMWAGHVAVVAKVVNGREILVNQANWPHGDVVEGAAVYDVSANNDWTTVRVANVGTMSWGRTNPTFGFIYPNGAPARDEPVVAQAQPQPRVERPQPRFQLAVAETEEDEPALSPHHAAPAPRDHERAKADKPAPRKELAAKTKREREPIEAKTAKAKPDRHERLEAKAEHRRRPEKPEIKTAARDEAKVDRARHEKPAAEKTKLAKAEHAKAEKTRLARAEHEKAEKTRLAKAEHAKAEKTRLAKAEHEPAKRHVVTKAAANRAHPPVRRVHVARNEQPAAQGAHIEQIAEVGRGGE